MIKSVGQVNIGTLGAVRELADSMGDLSARLNSYNLYARKQGRWQAKLFLEEGPMRSPRPRWVALRQPRKVEASIGPLQEVRLLAPP